MHKIYPVIMCGGIGSRLWPLSRPDRPKQFVQLAGFDSLFRETAARCMMLDNVEQILVVAGKAHRQVIEAQLNSISARHQLLLEPEGRDSAAAVAAAVAFVERIDPDAVVAIVSSDHFIPDNAHFKSDMQEAIRVAQGGKIVMLGITPTSANPAYGYIQGENSTAGVSNVVAFHEKPDVETAGNYIESGFSWNSGNFIASVKTLRDEFTRHAPDIFQTVSDSLGEPKTAGGALVLGDPFKTTRKTSIDRAIMEKTASAAVLKTDLEWSDLGAWDAVHKVAPKDASGNVQIGDAVLDNCKNSFIRVADGQFAVVSSVDGLNVIIENDVIFISTLNEAQRVKTVFDQLTEMQRPEVQSCNSHTMTLTDQAAYLSNWYRSQALPLWACYGLNRQTGIWHENLNRDRMPADSACRARVQGRQGFVYASALSDMPDMAITGDNPTCGLWQELVQLTLKGIEARYLDDQGWLRTLVDNNGAVLDETVRLYDQTFWLSAQARFAQALNAHNTAASKKQVAQLHKSASEILVRLKIRFDEDSFGGFREEGPNPFLCNPLMHLLEASLLWLEAIDARARKKHTAEATGQVPSDWHNLADSLVRLALERLFDPERGCIVEIYSEAWHPLPDSPVDPGHQLEWAWLLVQWYRRSGNQQALDCARRLYEAGCRGRHPVSGAIVRSLDRNFAMTDETARLWSQTEWLKASLVLFEETGDQPDLCKIYRDNADQAFATLTGYFETPVSGLWYDKLKPDNTFVDEPSPTSSMYHIAVAVQQLEESAHNTPQPKD